MPQNTEGVGSAQNTITGSVSPSTEQRSVAQLPKNTEGVSLNNDIGINKNQNTNIDIEHDVAIQNEIAQKIDNQNIISKIDTAYSDNTVKNNTAITSLKEDNNTKNIISKIDVSEHNIQQIRAISTLELLPILPSKEITFDKPLSHIALPITQPIYGRIVSVNIKDRPHFGLTMGAHTEGVTMIDGYQAGVFIQQKLPSKLPLSLQIGLNYRNTNTTGDSSGTAVFDPSSVSGASPNQNAFVITQASLNNISYIEMPIFLTYSPSKKWGIMGGIKGAYMISNKKNTTIWSVNNRYVVENGFSGTLLDMTQFKSANSTLNALDNFSQTLSFNRWDIAVVGGVSYLILPKTTLSLRADWGLKNVLNKQNWSANNRLLGLNMSYQF